MDPKYYQRYELRHFRGWTGKLVKTLLDPPDLIVFNPKVPTDPIKRYLKSRVHIAEKNPEFINGQGSEANKLRRESVRAYREKASRDLVESMYIRVRYHPAVSELALKHYWFTLKGGSEEEVLEFEPGSRAFLDRITVNYIVHHSSNYKDLLQICAFNSLTVGAHPLLKQKLYQTIIDVYPNLKDECLRQAKTVCVPPQ